VNVESSGIPQFNHGSITTAAGASIAAEVARVTCRRSLKLLAYGDEKPARGAGEKVPLLNTTGSRGASVVLLLKGQRDPYPPGG
jgi:hypothetical protein